MATEPMITIKDADGTMKQVPLSQLSATTPAATPASESSQGSDSTDVAPSTPTPPAPEPANDDIAELAARAAEQVAAESTPADIEPAEEAPITDTTEDLPTTDTRDEVVPIDTDTSDSDAMPQPDVDAKAKEISSTEETNGPVADDGSMHQDELVPTDEAVDQEPIVTVQTESPTQITSKVDSLPKPEAVEEASNETDLSAPIVTAEEPTTPVPEPAVTKDASFPPDDAPDDLLIITEPGALTTTVPNTHLFESHEDWDDTDHASLLDESLTEADTNIPHSTNRPGMAAALSNNTSPSPAPVQIEKKETETVVAPTTKPNAAQFTAAFAAVGGVPSDAPYTPGIKKVPMQDISLSAPTPRAPQPMGPVGELGAMTLDDFRRLGGRGEVGIADLRAKFEVLLKESIVTYMQGVAAWHRSPLYVAYLDVITASLSEQMPIADILAAQETNPQAITAAEWQALAHLHTEIRL